MKLTVLLGLSLCLSSGCSELKRPDVADRLQRARALAAPAEQEWRYYLGDQSSNQYSPLTQINRGNVGQLELAWRYDSSAGDDDLAGESQHNPLIIKGVLYGTAANAKRLFALNAATGEEIWTYTPSDTSMQVSRGLVYWSDEAGSDERILFGSGTYLHAIDARTGQPIQSFGKNGRVNLGHDLRDEPIDSPFLAATTPGVIYQDLLIQGLRVNEFSGAAPGHIRAYDVRSGALRWRFHTIPRPGEFGSDTWPAEALDTVGGANAWAGMALDAERGLVFIPTGSAAFDFFGADRAGDNLFANSLLALDAATGERRWHYQVVRHDLWDRDLPSPPNLITLERGNRSIDAVVQATKSGHLFVFDRLTGEPLFPVREEPVYGQALTGEFPPRSQPLPTMPPPFTAQGLSEDELAQRSPQVQAEAAKKLAGYVNDGVFNLPSLQGSILKPGFDGGAEWGGAAWDQDQGLLYINANELASIVQMYPAKGTSLTDAMNAESAYQMLCAQCHGKHRRGGGSIPSLRGIGSRLSPWEIIDVVRNGRGRMPGIDQRAGALGTLATLWYLYTADDDVADPQDTDEPSHFLNAGYPNFLASDNLPATAPPWGTLNAIDLESGSIRWRIPLGDYPQALAQGLRGMGAANYGGPVATAGGLLFIGATPDARFRAFDSSNGKLLWETDLPAGGFATPAVYKAGGRQYVVINASGTKMQNPAGRYYLAFSLPANSQSSEAR